MNGGEVWVTDETRGSAKQEDFFWEFIGRNGRSLCCPKKQLHNFKEEEIGDLNQPYFYKTID